MNYINTSTIDPSIIIVGKIADEATCTGKINGGRVQDIKCPLEFEELSRAKKAYRLTGTLKKGPTKSYKDKIEYYFELKSLEPT